MKLIFRGFFLIRLTFEFIGTVAKNMFEWRISCVHSSNKRPTRDLRLSTFFVELPEKMSTDDLINYAKEFQFPNWKRQCHEIRGFRMRSFLVSSFSQFCGFLGYSTSLNFSFFKKHQKCIAISEEDIQFLLCFFSFFEFLMLRHFSFSIFHSEWFQFQFVTRITLRRYWECRGKQTKRNEEKFTDYIFRIIAPFDME